MGYQKRKEKKTFSFDPSSFQLTDHDHHANNTDTSQKKGKKKIKVEKRKKKIIKVTKIDCRYSTKLPKLGRNEIDSNNKNSKFLNY